MKDKAVFKEIGNAMREAGLLTGSDKRKAVGTTLVLAPRESRKWPYTKHRRDLK